VCANSGSQKHQKENSMHARGSKNIVVRFFSDKRRSFHVLPTDVIGTVNRFSSRKPNEHDFVARHDGVFSSVYELPKYVMHFPSEAIRFKTPGFYAVVWSIEAKMADTPKPWQLLLQQPFVETWVQKTASVADIKNSSVDPKDAQSRTQTLHYRETFLSSFEMKEGGECVNVGLLVSASPQNFFSRFSGVNTPSIEKLNIQMAVCTADKFNLTYEQYEAAQKTLKTSPDVNKGIATLAKNFGLHRKAETVASVQEPERRATCSKN
jgi:hypothetical protein